jgi:hypothetical protein
MGYYTDFDGKFEITPPLSEPHWAYLQQFARVRHMCWHADQVATLPDPIRKAVGLPVGTDGVYLTDDLAYKASYTVLGASYDYTRHESIKDSNRPPGGVPELWCHWIPTEDGTALQADQETPFYKYISWLHFLLLSFLMPWGYTLNGCVTWQGQDSDDRGVIVVERNSVMVSRSK